MDESQKFRDSQLPLKSQILSFAHFLRRSFFSICDNIMIRCALDGPDLGQAFKYLGRYHITHRKFSRANWSRKVSQKLDESQKFRESQLVLKSQILYFPLIPRRCVISTHRMNIIWCALESPDLGKLLNNLCALISPIENFLEPLEVEKFLKKWWKSENAPRKTVRKAF